jgi:hypothetical protein
MYMVQPAPSGTCLTPRRFPDAWEQRLLPKVLDAANRFGVGLSDAEMAADEAELAIQPMSA